MIKLTVYEHLFDRIGLNDGPIRQLLEERDAIGREKHRKNLYPFDGKDFKQELIEELGDALIYCEGLIMQAEIEGNDYSIWSEIFSQIFDLISAHVGFSAYERYKKAHKT